MLEFMRRNYTIWCQSLWLRRIDREINRCNRLKQKLKRRHHAVKELADGYFQTFGENLVIKETQV